MKARKTDPLDDKAEGRCCGLPYATELVSINGCSIHFWVGETYDAALVERALHTAIRNRDIVRAYWSHGQPSAFWAEQDMRE